jgi:hypothetical protein
MPSVDVEGCTQEEPVFDIDNVIAEFEAGRSVTDVAEALDMDVTDFRRTVEDEGYRPPTETDTKRTRALIRLRAGGTSKEAVEASGLCEQTVRKLARLHNIPTDRRNHGGKHPDHWQPSEAALEALTELGCDLDSVRWRPRCTPRDAGVLEVLFVERTTLQEAGDRHGISRERVRQILKHHTGMASDGLRDRRKRISGEEDTRRRHETVYALAAANPSATLRQIARKAGVPRTEVIAMLGEDAFGRHDPNTWVTATVSDAEILDEIRRVAALPDGVPLSSTFFDANRSAGFIGKVRIMQRFGTWSEACAAAGVESRVSFRPNYGRRWNRKQMLGWADQYLSETGAGGSYADFTAWLKARSGDGAPSSQTIRNYIGPWREVLDEVQRMRAAS